MDAPKCRLCQERHYGLCSFVVKSEPKEKQPSAAKSVVVKTSLPLTRAKDLSTAPIVKRTRAPNGTFDRKTYQRDLMRVRRAAVKDSGANR